jgi:hypothetical protein
MAVADGATSREQTGIQEVQSQASLGFQTVGLILATIRLRTSCERSVGVGRGRRISIEEYKSTFRTVRTNQVPVHKGVQGTYPWDGGGRVYITHPRMLPRVAKGDQKGHHDITHSAR